MTALSPSRFAIILLVLLVSVAGLSRRDVLTAPAAPAAPDGSSGSLASIETLGRDARARVGATPRVELRPVTAALSDAARLYGPDAPSYLQVFAGQPDIASSMAEAVEAFLYRGAVATDVKAGMGLRIAQINGSPYVAAHMQRLLRGSPRGREVLQAVTADSLAALTPEERLALTYASSLTRSVVGVTDDDFAAVRGRFDDGEIVELTLTVSFFNYLTRYAEALRLPVEPWALDAPAPASAAKPRNGKPRVALISDAEIAATAAATAAAADAAKNPAAQRGGLGLRMANSQRAMLRAPAVALPWRAYSTAARQLDRVGRDIKLQVSFAVSMANGCRYCTLHQVLGLRRLGVEPAKLVAMRKDDSALTPRELAAVRFARTLTETPSAVSDADYAALRTEFGDQGALELVLQTCNFAFMNRFTDGLRLPSEDEAVQVYQEVYGTAFTPQR